MSSHKRALIIGINKYLCYSSKYCVNDANDLSMTLQRIGFETHIAFDCNLREFGDHINQFLQLIQPNDVVLFYFAGHGKYNRYEYYLLPSDYIYNLRTDQYDYIIRNAINNLMKKIHKSKCSIPIYLFDCCRLVRETRATSTNDRLLLLFEMVDHYNYRLQQFDIEKDYIRRRILISKRFP